MEPRTPSGTDVTGTLPAAGQGTSALEPVAPPPPSPQPDWVQEARAGLAAPGRFLAYEESGRRRVLPVDREWTRVGRSLSAEVRFDDATVSRRHALIVVQADGVRVLDDRSLNGVFVNGRRVEWSPLADGDEIAVGRHRLWFLEAVSGEARAPAPAAAAT